MIEFLWIPYKFLWVPHEFLGFLYKFLGTPMNYKGFPMSPEVSLSADPGGVWEALSSVVSTDCPSTNALTHVLTGLSLRVVLKAFLRPHFL